MKNTIRITGVLALIAFNANPCMAQASKKTMESSLHASGGDEAAASKCKTAAGNGSNNSTPDKARGVNANKSRGADKLHKAETDIDKKKARHTANSANK